MGVGKVVSFGFSGFMLVGLAAMPFVPEMTPEQDLASGKRTFADRCDDVTRNRTINGSLGRGPAYCQCIAGSLDGDLATGDEYRYAARMQTAAGTERWVFEEARREASMKRAIEAFDPLLGRERIAQLRESQDLRPFHVTGAAERVVRSRRRSRRPACACPCCGRG